MRPRIAVVLGDPAGIGPELIARLLGDPATLQAADILLIADSDELRGGMEVAGCTFPFQTIDGLDAPSFSDRPLLYAFQGTAPRPFPRREASEAGGRYSLETLGLALDLAQAGTVDALLFGPLNKESLHMANMGHSDELHWFAERLGHTAQSCEFTVLDDLWTSRVTSHVALKDVASLISERGIVGAIKLIDRALKSNGVTTPRIAVCGLNPHNGDNGVFGREEIEIIAPAVAEARRQGLVAEGPFPADTIFLKVVGETRQYDAVVTMYHDQGQIAIKLLGFSRGVTVQGGLPIPITTPAHGTAFDIATLGRADVGATRQAFQIACRMGRSRAMATRGKPL